tara:strand:+ start:208 stop:381 length:174 start_codon:yes stop_codon:yes gene_type:complete
MEKYKIVFYRNNKVVAQWKGYTSYGKVMKDYWSEYFAYYYETTEDIDIQVFSNESIV